MDFLSKIDTFLYSKWLSSTPNNTKSNRYITHQKIAKICVFLAIFGLKNGRVWPESVWGIQNFLYDLGYPIRCSKKFLVMLRKVKGTFPKKVDPLPPKRSFLGGGWRFKISLNPVCFEQYIQVEILFVTFIRNTFKTNL